MKEQQDEYSIGGASRLRKGISTKGMENGEVGLVAATETFRIDINRMEGIALRPPHGGGVKCLNCLAGEHNNCVCYPVSV